LHSSELFHYKPQKESYVRIAQRMSIVQQRFLLCLCS